MLISNSDKNRLTIYFFFDEDGIVDEYVIKMLKEVKKFSNNILFVSNGKIKCDEKIKVEKLADFILERTNEGFDCGAYKDALEYIGWDVLTEYVEVILMNYTIMGPINSFNDMFEKMDNMDLDFWGVTKHYQIDTDPFGTCKYGYIPEHIQSHFITIRQSILKTKQFRDYWDKMPKIKKYEESIGYHEVIFTKHFADMGYRWDVYCNTDDVSNLAWFPLMQFPVEMVEKYKCPIIKRRSFFTPYSQCVSEGIGDATSELYQYLNDQTNYDVNLIWDNILRTCNHADFNRTLHLDYILSSRYSDEELSCKIINSSRICLVMHIYYEDKIDEMLRYASNVPDKIDMYITTMDDNKKKHILDKAINYRVNIITVRVVENRGRDVSALLIGMKDIILGYDLVCFMHDKKVEQSRPGITGEGFAKKCFQNIVYNREFINNILITFSENPRLGLLVPPFPNHGAYYNSYGSEWTMNYENVVDLLKRLGIKVPIDESKPPIAPYGSVFWFRPAALKKIFEYDWKYEDFSQEPMEIDGTISHAIERIYPFVAQDAGYYSGLVMSDKFSQIEYTNLDYYLKEYKNGHHYIKAIRGIVNQIKVKCKLNSKILKIKRGKGGK